MKRWSCGVWGRSESGENEPNLSDKRAIIKKFGNLFQGPFDGAKIGLPIFASEISWLSHVILYGTSTQEVKASHSASALRPKLGPKLKALAVSV